MRCALALVVAHALLTAARSVNYCGAKMCAHTNAHTFCQYPPGPSPNCRGYMDAHLTPEEKGLIVARLNRRRNEAASGRLKRLATAGDMLKLRWVEELAREAQRWADQCRPPQTPDEQDSCRDLFSTTVGQCVTSVVGEAPGLRVESMVDMWYMQSMLYKGNATYYIVPMSNISYYGDFAQMIWSRTYMVGCGRSRFMSEWNGRMRSVERLVCNFAPRGPVQYRPLWAPAVPASVCPPRSVPDTTLISLCNYQQDIDISSDVEGIMTTEEHILLSIVLEIENKPALNRLGSLDEMYMTKLAVVTMDDRVTTVSYFNPIHKRDIIETIGLDENIVHIDNVLVENDINDFLNATRIIVRIEEKTTEAYKHVTKKVKLIGRPKSYNLEDLNIIDGDHNLPENTNLHDDLPVRDVTKIDDRDVYLDYAFLDIEENITYVSEPATTLNVIVMDSQTNSNSDNIAININPQGNTPPTESVAILSEMTEDVHQMSNPEQAPSSERTVSFIDHFKNVSKNINITTVLPYISHSDDDYFTDPETVRDLQEALDRMEHSLEENRPAGKVRRELRNPPAEEQPPNIPDENVRLEDDHVGKQYDPVPENYKNVMAMQNKTDKSPMLNMVLKYMPYLKPYQNEILGTTDSHGCTVVLSYGLLSFGVMLVYSS